MWAHQTFHHFFLLHPIHNAYQNTNNSKQQKKSKLSDIIKIFLSLHLQLHAITAQVIYQVGIEVSVPTFCILTIGWQNILLSWCLMLPLHMLLRSGCLLVFVSPVILVNWYPTLTQIRNDVSKNILLAMCCMLLGMASTSWHLIMVKQLSVFLTMRSSSTNVRSRMQVKWLQSPMQRLKRSQTTWDFKVCIWIF